MAESRAKRLRAVLLLAQREEDAAAGQMGKARDLVAEEQQQLVQLREYRQEYVWEYQQQRSGVRPEVLMSYSGFIQRLSQAVTGQEHKLAQLEGQLEECQAVWQEKHHRRKTLADLIARLQRDEDAALEHRLQRELDDLAAQTLSRRQRLT